MLGRIVQHADPRVVHFRVLFEQQWCVTTEKTWAALLPCLFSRNLQSLINTDGILVLLLSLWALVRVEVFAILEVKWERTTGKRWSCRSTVYATAVVLVWAAWFMAWAGFVCDFCDVTVVIWMWSFSWAISGAKGGFGPEPWVLRIGWTCAESWELAGLVLYYTVSSHYHHIIERRRPIWQNWN
jgi:hypothetical protein